MFREGSIFRLVAPSTAQIRAYDYGRKIASSLSDTLREIVRKISVHIALVRWRHCLQIIQYKFHARRIHY